MFICKQFHCGCYVNMSTDRSLMYIRKKSGPKVDPCGTPAFTDNHSDV